MSTNIPRRDFLASTPAAMYLAGTALNNSPAWPTAAAGSAKIYPFDYQGVTLRPSRWKAQADAGREFYFGLSNDDTLCGDRKVAGLPAPGHEPADAVRPCFRHAAEQVLISAARSLR